MVLGFRGWGFWRLGLRVLGFGVQGIIGLVSFHCKQPIRQVVNMVDYHRVLNI